MRKIGKKTAKTVRKATPKPPGATKKTTKKRSY